ncbi:MAG TPA: polysaccharide deacetylase family protein [Myxococcota bacterium]|nr:polysaccharide deacetylase family protein [Myxococcota bacterium]
MAALPHAIACFTFDNMGEAAELGAGALPVPQPRALHPSLSRGYPRIFDLLERHAVRATFFVEGWNGLHHPDAVAEIVRRGHELGMHGFLHERWSSLSPGEQTQLSARATDALSQAAGVRPRGFRAPGGARTPQTEGILLALGYAYDASLGSGMRPERLAQGLAQVPFVWPCVDGFHYLREPPAKPEEVREAWLRALARTACEGGLFVTVCHAFVTGLEPARIEVLGDVMAAAAADPRVSVMQVGEVAQLLLADSAVGA